jgi:hypothetical protein
LSYFGVPSRGGMTRSGKSEYYRQKRSLFKRAIRAVPRASGKNGAFCGTLGKGTLTPALSRRTGRGSGTLKRSAGGAGRGAMFAALRRPAHVASDCRYCP